MLLEIYSLDKKQYFGIGEITKYIQTKILGELIKIPVIQLANGKQIYGHECWYHEKIN